MKKKILVFVLAIALVLASFIGYLPKVNADSSIDYGEYNYLISVYNLDDNYVYFYLNASISDNNGLLYDDTGEPSYADNTGLITEKGIYLVNASLLNNTSAIYYYYLSIDLATSYFGYVNTFGYSEGYNAGYSVGTNETMPYIYDQGYTDGYNSVVPGNSKYNQIYMAGVNSTGALYVEGASGYNSIYNAGYQQAMEDMEATEDGEANFLVMFKTIINYITDFFTVGLNVEIFGVNIGDFCVGIFLLAVVMFLLRLVFGR